MIKKREELKLGEAYLPQHISRTLKHLSLGMPKASPSSSTIIRSSLMMLYFYCFIPVYSSLERQFIFVSFVLFAALYLLDPSILVWERDTLHFFH